MIGLRSYQDIPEEECLPRHHKTPPQDMVEALGHAVGLDLHRMDWDEETPKRRRKPKKYSTEWYEQKQDEGDYLAHKMMEGEE